MPRSGKPAQNYCTINEEEIDWFKKNLFSVQLELLYFYSILQQNNRIKVDQYLLRFTGLKIFEGKKNG